MFLAELLLRRITGERVPESHSSSAAIAMPNYQRPPVRQTGSRSSTPLRGAAVNPGLPARRSAGSSAARRVSQGEQGEAIVAAALRSESPVMAELACMSASSCE
ncbi:unnamed protein product, partial [Candidula unifasciata]